MTQDRYRPSRFAIWAAVSTEAQAADDRASLPEQETRCRSVATSKGWVEACGPYIVPGESRTRWVNLRDAEREIPALREMLDDAQRNRFDILVLFDFNRLRDLLDPVAKTLSSYGVQLYSVSQPIEPLPIDTFTPYSSDASSMMQGLAQIISRAQIADLRRKYQYGVPHRVTRGLHPVGRLPWGYSKPPGRESDKNSVPILDPAKALVLLRIRDELLAGKSCRQIADELTAEHVPSPTGGKWDRTFISHAARNPFYAGLVVFGVHSDRRDPRTGHRHETANPPDRWLVERGKHQPVWTERDRHRMIAKLDEHTVGWRGKANTHLTGLLFCSTCGRPLRIRLAPNRNGRARRERATYVCRTSSSHARISYTRAVQLVGEMLVPRLREHRLSSAASTNGRVALAKSALDAATVKRERYQRAYGDGAFDLASYTKLAAEVDAEIDASARALSDAQAYDADLADEQETAALIEANADRLPEFLADTDGQTANSLLRAIISRVVVGRHTIETIEFG